MRDVCAAYSLPASWRTRGNRELGVVALGGTPMGDFVGAVRDTVSGRIGLSGLFVSLRQAPEAYRLANAALQTLPQDAADVAWIDDRLVEAILVAHPDLARLLASRILGAVLELDAADGGLLLDTLEAWYAGDCSATAAAARLRCHRNTVLNRLRRVEMLTGLSFEDHRDLTMCYLALLSLRLVPLTR
jgi:DNA-binding PucR family transcriptional regulator